MTDTNESRRLRAEAKLYPDHNPAQLDRDGNYYIRHVSAMTREGLHAKSDIAIQLGWRDREIDRLRAELAVAIAAMGPDGVPPLPVEGIEEVGR